MQTKLSRELNSKNYALIFSVFSHLILSRHEDGFFMLEAAIKTAASGVAS